MTEEQVSRLKEKLREEARSKFPDDKEKQDAYIFGTLRRLGWKPRSK